MLFGFDNGGQTRSAKANACSLIAACSPDKTRTQAVQLQPEVAETQAHLPVSEEVAEGVGAGKDSVNLKLTIIKLSKLQALDGNSETLRAFLKSLVPEKGDKTDEEHQQVTVSTK